MGSDVSTTDPPPSTPDKRWVGRSFSDAAPVYDRVASLQRHVGEQLLGEIARKGLTPRTLIDLGCGTGYCTDRLARLYPNRMVYGLDLAEGMLRELHARHGEQPSPRLICGDFESLPFAGGIADLVFSNLAMQWCQRLGTAFTEVRMALGPGGHFAFSTFGRDTLKELRKAWACVDRQSHVNDFPAAETLRRELSRAGFVDIAVREETILVNYPGVDELMRNLKTLGARNLTAGRPRQLTGKGRLRAMIEAYPARGPDGGIAASFHVAYCHGRRA